MLVVGMKDIMIECTRAFLMHLVKDIITDIIADHPADIKQTTYILTKKDLEKSRSFLHLTKLTKFANLYM